MYITCIVYALCLALCVWGGKFSGFGGGRFHEDSSSLEATKGLRGLAALGVILHHISQEAAFQQAQGEGFKGIIPFFTNIGYLFVAVFFFWSGFGLFKSLETKEDYLDGFMSRRVVKVLVIPFYVNVLLYAAFHLVMRTKLHPVQWLTNFLGLTLMNEYAWYPIVAGLLYAAFYVIFKHVKDRRLCFALMALIVLAQGLFFCVNGHFAWWAGAKNWWLSPSGWARAKWWMQFKVFWFSGEWWVNSSPAFCAGLLFARFERQIRSFLTRRYWPKLLALLALMAASVVLSSYGQARFGYWTEFSGKGPGITEKLASYLLQVPSSLCLVALLFAVMLKYYASNPVTRFFGSLSLETYMMNLLAIMAFRFLLYTDRLGGQPLPVYRTAYWNLALYAAAVLAATILLALAYRRLNKLAVSLFRKSPIKQ